MSRSYISCPPSAMACSGTALALTHHAGGLHSGCGVDGVSEQAISGNLEAHNSSNHRARVDSCRAKRVKCERHVAEVREFDIQFVCTFFLCMESGRAATLHTVSPRTKAVLASKLN
jgi:hypothetical protein